MKQDIYIDAEGKLYGIEPSQQHLIKPEWTLCEKKPDGSNADYYNTDGTIAPDPEPTEEEVRWEARRRADMVCPSGRMRGCTARYNALVRKAGKGGLNPAQQTQKDDLDAIWDAIDLLEDRAETLIEMTPIPQDYTNDTYWI